ncbi:unnamed protein product [Camellia sinensis]
MASLLTQPILFYLQILGLLIASVCVPVISGGGVVEAREQREFDYFVLALQWPGTFCRRTHHCCSSNGCCRGFTIHGLWSNYNDGTWPACCTGSNFDIKELGADVVHRLGESLANPSYLGSDISTLLDALEKYWPSLSCGSSSTCHGGKGLFWAHEWEKHGTCSSPVIRDEYNYFLTTLNVYFKYNVTLINNVLNEAGYVPSNSEKYPLGGIISAIENAFHATPLVVCSDGAVEELRLCFYKDFKPRDCVIGFTSQDDIISSKSSCPKYVSLPAFASVAGLKMEGLHFHGYLNMKLFEQPIPSKDTMRLPNPLLYLFCVVYCLASMACFLSSLQEFNPSLRQKITGVDISLKWKANPLGLYGQSCRRPAI